MRKICLLTMLMVCLSFSQPFTYDPSAILSIGNVTLLKSVEETKSHFSVWELKEKNDALGIYKYKGLISGSNLEWSLNFNDFGSASIILISITVSTQGNLEDWNKLVENYMKTINKPVKLSKPVLVGQSSGYMANWKTGSGNTITNVSIFYNPENNTLFQSVIIDLFAFLGTTLEKELESIKK